MVKLLNCLRSRAQVRAGHTAGRSGVRLQPGQGEREWTEVEAAGGVGHQAGQVRPGPAVSARGPGPRRAPPDGHGCRQCRHGGQTWPPSRDGGEEQRVLPVLLYVGTTWEMFASFARQQEDSRGRFLRENLSSKWNFQNCWALEGRT